MLANKRQHQSTDENACVSKDAHQTRERTVLTLVMWASSISSWDSVALGSGRTVTAMTLEFTTVWFLGVESQKSASTLGDLLILIQPARYRLPLTDVVFRSVRKLRLHLNVKRSSGAWAADSISALTLIPLHTRGLFVCVGWKRD